MVGLNVNYVTSVPDLLQILNGDPFGFKDDGDTMSADVGSTLGTPTSAADSSEDEVLLSTEEERCACQCGYAVAALKAQVNQLLQTDVISRLISRTEALERRRQLRGKRKGQQ